MYVRALTEDMCEILMKCMIHILKALDVRYSKMQEKVEIITNHIHIKILEKISQNRQCVYVEPEIRIMKVI